MLLIGASAAIFDGVDLRNGVALLDRALVARGRRDDGRQADRDRADREVDRDFLVARVTVTCFFCSAVSDAEHANLVTYRRERREGGTALQGPSGRRAWSQRFAPEPDSLVADSRRR